jgi:GntR family transcriptional regulator
MQLDRKSPKPLHLQIEELIRGKIADDEWPPGSLIESENEFSAKYGISRMTVRNVITKLVHEGLLFRIPGKGTYVSEPKITAKALSYAGIREQLEEQGYTISTTLLSISREHANEELCEIFNVSADTEFFVIKRLRSIKNKPLSIHYSYVAANMAKDLDKLDFVNEQLCKILSKQYGLIRDRTRETLEVVPASKEDAKLLEISKGYPLLMLHDTLFDKNGMPFEDSIIKFRGEMIKIKLEL